MADKKYLLVCEGPSDIEVLQAMSAAITNVNGNVIEIVPLAPQADKTSGKYPSFGWTAVRTWCMSYRQKSATDVAHLDAVLQAILRRKNWKSLVIGSGADGLIVQIDTDIAEDIVDLPVDFATSGMTRKHYTEAAVLNWLSIPAYPTNSLFLVLSTYSTEAWILACHDPTDAIFSDLPPGFSYENLHDAEERLIKKGFRSKQKKGRKRLQKTSPIYKIYGADIAASLALVRGRCQEANSLCTYLESV